MKKQTIFKITFSAAVLITAVLFTGCPRDPKNGNQQLSQEEPPEDNSTPTTIPIPKLSFNRSNAEALAATTATSENRSARDADSDETPDSDTFLQKILADGTVEAAMNLEYESEEASWSTVNYFIQTPENVDSKDVYLLMKEYSRALVTVDGTSQYWNLSPLLCIHEDNSYDDVFLTSPYDNTTSYVIDYKENLQFLKDGTLIYLCRSPGGDIYYIKKWNPKTKETTDVYEIQPAEDEESTQIERFAIDATEDYVYMYINSVKTDGTGNIYLKIIQISDSSFSKEISNVEGWCYNTYDDCLYYSRPSTEDSGRGVFKTDKDGSILEHPTQIEFNQLIPQSAEKVWGFRGYTDSDNKLQNIFSGENGSEQNNTHSFNEQFLYPTSPHYYFLGDYIFANDNLYLNHRYYCDSTSGHKDAIIVVPLNGTNDDISNLLDFNLNIQLHSWSVNKNYLFISGTDYETKEPVNCRINLKTGEQLTIQSDEAFGAIAAL